MSTKKARDLGLDRAKAAADNCGQFWQTKAMLAFRDHAKTHKVFTTEDVRLKNKKIKTSGDPRAWGHIAKSAQRAGYIEPKGYTPVTSSNGSAKVLWASLIFIGEKK